MTTTGPLVFLDDDPTGTQAVTNVPVLLRWDTATLATALQSRPRAIHVLTNSRAFPAEQAEAIVLDAALAVRAVTPTAQLVVRGDSTLRGHLLEEYRAVWRATEHQRPPVLLLVPALPAAGRITRGGVHYLVRDGHAVPLSETEYAADGAFAYHSPRLLEWAQERSGGLFEMARGKEVALAQLRARGPDSVTEALTRAADAGGPSVCAPDAETVDDLELIAAGLRRALAAGVTVATRCAPTFAGVLAGTLANGYVAPPQAGAGVLIVCGSYVANTTRQLEYLCGRRGICAIELDPVVLAGDGEHASKTIADAAELARKGLKNRRVALVATARRRPSGTRDFETGMRIARRLASIVPAIGDAADVIIAKGGITSAVTVQEGLGAVEALAVGPLMPGVVLWQPKVKQPRSYVVVPGNVGGHALLAELLELLEV